MFRLGFIILINAFVVLFSSCAEQCNIAGSSTLGSLDGRMLYLRVSHNGIATNNVDSCEVIHGRFNFYSNVDSVMVAQVFMGNDAVMPVVIENGNLNVVLDHVGQRVSGGPLNDKLYRFLQKKERLENQQWELDRRCMRMMHEGHSPDEVQRIIGPKASKLTKQTENLETRFIIDNFDNPLATGCFMWLFGQYPVPVMTEQIETIVKVAPPHFLQDPFVCSYLYRARRNMKLMKGAAPIETLRR